MNTELNTGGDEELLKGFAEELEKAKLRPESGYPSNGRPVTESRYTKPLVPLREDEIQLYTDPNLNRRFMSEKVKDWAFKLGEHVFASGKSVYVRIGETGAFQAHSLAGLIYIIVREALRPYFGWLRRKPKKKAQEA